MLVEEALSHPELVSICTCRNPDVLLSLLPPQRAGGATGAPRAPHENFSAFLLLESGKLLLVCLTGQPELAICALRRHVNIKCFAQAGGAALWSEAR